MRNFQYVHDKTYSLDVDGATATNHVQVELAL